MDQYTRLDPAERWMRDGLSVIDPAGFFVSAEIDMTDAARLLSVYKEAGHEVTYTHVFVRAAAEVFSRNPDLHQLVGHRQRLRPASVDIGLSISGQMFVAPVLVIRDAARKTLLQVASEVRGGAQSAREDQGAMLKTLRTWGGLVPLRSIRRFILRRLIWRVGARRQENGTFQVSCLAGVDQFVPLLFVTTGILGVGRVKERVVVRDGKPVVRPTAIVSCGVDHKVWDGRAAQDFLRDLEAVLTSPIIDTLFGD